jgi:hypothetical protein
MTNHRIRPARHYSPVGRDEPERPAKRYQGSDDEEQTSELEDESGADAPDHVDAGGPQEQAAEGAAGRQQPAPEVLAHSARWAPNQKGDHKPGLLDAEQTADQPMCLDEILDAGFREPRCERSSREVHQDAHDAVNRRRAMRRQPE